MTEPASTAADHSEQHFQDVLRLRRRVKALEKLNAVYRTEGRPSESLHEELAKTKDWAQEIFIRTGLETP